MKIANYRQRMAVLTMALASVVSSSVSAAMSYTSTWSNAEGAGVIKQWNDAANWTVTHAESVPAPASSVPTKDSRAVVSRSCAIAFQNGDDLQVGELRFISDVGSKTGKLTIPQGARLSLDGTGLASYFGTDVAMGYPGGHNHITVDVDGGNLVFGQKEVWLKSAWNKDESLVYFKIHNGGALSITNGTMFVTGGSQESGGGGMGPSTNLIEVVDGGSLVIKKGSVSFSRNDAPFTGGNVGGGCNIVNVRDGGKWLMSKDADYFFSRQQAGAAGTFINIGPGGLVDFSGKHLMFVNKGTNVVTMTGGVMTNVVFSQQEDEGTGKLQLDLRGGDCVLDALAFGTSSGRKNGSIQVSIHGTRPNVRPLRWVVHANYTKCSMFMDFKLAANTPRDALGIAPFITRGHYYDSGCGQNRYLYGYYRLAPEGGIQIVHTNAFDLVMRPYDGNVNFLTENSNYSTYGGVVGGDLWKTNSICEDKTNILGLTNPHRFRFLLNDDAKFELDDDGACTVAGTKARGYIELPQISARKLERMKRASVYLKLEPQGSKTVQNLVDGIVAGGLTNAMAVAEDGYNVRVDLPVDQLAAQCTTDCVVFDFTDVPGFVEASQNRVTTNAVIKAVRWAPDIASVGMMLLVR